MVIILNYFLQKKNFVRFFSPSKSVLNCRAVSVEFYKSILNSAPKLKPNNLNTNFS